MLRWGLRVIYAFTAVLGRPAFAQTNPSVAFFYGKPVPVGQLGRFDWVVVEPDRLDARGLDELQRAGVQVLGVGLSAARWTGGPTTLLLDAWLGELTPPRRLAYRAQPGLAIQPFGGAELPLTGYVANDNWMIGRGELGMTASLTYRFTPPES